jgi:citrate synthase
MFEDLKINVKDWSDDAQIEKYLTDLLDKNAFDRSGLIYGMGHAVYTISDPRARILKEFTGRLAKAKGLMDEYDLYERVERLAPEVIGKKKHIYKGVSANVDFYSGFIYNMLNLPTELYTPLFAVARIAGWSAHRIEELINGNKIIRPAYMSISEHRDYVKLSDR